MSKVKVSKRGNKGFTLIELLVVVVIIGVLAAVALPNLLGQTDKARTTEATSILSAINTGQEAQFTENQAYATVGTFTALADGDLIPAAATVATIKASAKGLDNGVVVTTAALAADMATIMGVNVAASQWDFATTAVAAAGGVPATWTALAEGRDGVANGLVTNLSAYTQRDLGRTLLDSDSQTE